MAMKVQKPAYSDVSEIDLRLYVPVFLRETLSFFFALTKAL